jgi:hypothetical protein
MAMEPIPMPDLLDDQAQLLISGGDLASTRRALRDVCAYGHQLWDELDTVRKYLLESSAGGRARPLGPDDDAGWDAWMNLFSGVVTDLAGPRGDGGYGRDEARAMAGIRRDPNRPGPEAARGE